MWECVKAILAATLSRAPRCLREQSERRAWGAGLICLATSLDATCRASAAGALCQPPDAYTWVHQFGTSSQDIGRDLAVDADGHVYVTGWTGGTFPGDEPDAGAFLAKFDSDGTQLWLKLFGVTSEDRGVGVTVDGIDAVYVSGVTWGAFPGEIPTGGGTDAFLARFNSDGTMQWVTQFGGGNSDQGYRVVVDHAGDVFTSGSTLGTFPGQESSGNRDAFLAKYSPDGHQLWLRQIGSENFDSGPALAVDSAGNAYMGGYTVGALPGQEYAGGVDTFLVKYSSTGQLLWIDQFGTPQSTHVTDLAIDANDAIYVSGHASGDLLGQQNVGEIDAYLVKYSPDGTRLWARQFGTTALDRGYGVDVDGHGNVYVTGYTMGQFPNQHAGSGADAFVASYTPDGTQLWVRQSGTLNSHFGRTVAVDDAQGVYVAGWTQGSFPGQQSVGATDIYILKWDDCHPFTLKPGAKDPPQPVNVNLPSFNGEKNLLFLTHGCCTTAASFEEMWQPWEADLLERIEHDDDWLVYVHAWSPSPELTLAPRAALEQAKVLGPKFASEGYEHVHLIAHGAGAFMVTAIACTIEQQSPQSTVHVTYLDAATGVMADSGLGCPGITKTVQPAQDLHGQYALWSDHYRADDPCWTGTDTGVTLANAHNIDVTGLDPDKQEWCKSSHLWPACFYRHSIDGQAEPCTGESLDEADYWPFGFMLSVAKIGAHWKDFVQHFPAGDVTGLPGLNGNELENGGETEQATYRIRVDDPIDIAATETMTATPESVIVDGMSATATAVAEDGAAWINLLIETDFPSNFVRFDAEFTSEPRADGLLTVYLNGRAIGSLNEQTVSSTALADLIMHEDLNAGTHVLGFRLDEFGGLPSDLQISNVATGRAAFVNIADVNVDGVVDVFDLLLLISQWGDCDEPEHCPADLNSDGVVDVLDLLKLISHWG